MTPVRVEPPLAALRVMELLALVRAAGLRQLARSCRRAELLVVLATAHDPVVAIPWGSAPPPPRSAALGAA